MRTGLRSPARGDCHAAKRSCHSARAASRLALQVGRDMRLRSWLKWLRTGEWTLASFRGLRFRRNRRIARPRLRNGRGAFSALLRAHRPASRSSPQPGSLSAAPQERSRSVTMVSGRPWRFVDFFRSFRAALRSRDLVAKLSSSSPPRDQQGAKGSPLAVDLHQDPLGHASISCRAVPSLRCQRHWRQDRIRSTRRRRISAASIGPNLFHQKRTVSWLISMPRSCRRSSTFRSDAGKRIYIITVRRMISGDVLKWREGPGLVMVPGQTAPPDPPKPSCSDRARLSRVRGLEVAFLRSVHRVSGRHVGGVAHFIKRPCDLPNPPLEPSAPST